MLTLQQSLSLAVKTQMARQNMNAKQLKTRLGWSLKGPKLTNRLIGEKPWDTTEIEPLAKALGLKDEWTLLNLAKKERQVESQIKAA